MNKNNRLLKYSDVVLVPRLSNTETRGAINVGCKFGNQSFNLPVVPANMKTVINEELAKQMSDEFEKQRVVGDIKLGKDPETGVIILDEDPQWVWIREDSSGAYIELRLDKEYGYVLNIIQSEFEQYDFELGGIENAITIQQIN